MSFIQVLYLHSSRSIIIALVSDQRPSIFQWNSSWKIAIYVFLVSHFFYVIWSIVVLHYFPVTYVEQNFQNQPLLVVLDLNTSDRHVYSRIVDGRVRHFTPQSADLFQDQTGTIWSLSCECAISGLSKGQRLSEANLSSEEFYPYKGVSAYSEPLIAIWQRFDANWYSTIAIFGYGHNDGDVHFPPLFPVLIQWLMPLTHHPFTAGMLLSNFFTLIMLAILHGYVSKRFDESVSTRTLIYLMVFPSAFFFYSAYTESLFILLVLLSFIALQNESWGYAGLWAFLSILTRLQGIVLFLPLCFELYRARKLVLLKDMFFALGFPLLGVFVYLFIRWSAGDPSVLPLSEATLHARQVFPWVNYWYGLKVLFSGEATIVDLLNLILTSIFAVLIVMGWKYMPLSLNLFLVASFFVFTSRLVDTQPLNSILRYVITLFPCFIFLAVRGKESPLLHRAILYIGLLLSMYLSAQFWLWGWVA